MFWFWSSNPVDHWLTSLVYAVPFAAALWAISRYRVGGLTSLILVAPLFAYVTEGVITPVMYSGGPLIPFFPAWFTFWHGFIGLVGLWYLLHLWMVRGRRKLILAASVGLGAFWGLWSTTLWLPENVGDPELIADNGGPLTVLGPAAFARYVASFTVLLAAFHWLWGRLRVADRFEPPVWLRGIYLVAAGGVLVMWTVAVPWALPMFVLYAGVQVLLLRRRSRLSRGPTLLETLSGPVPAASLLPLAAVPAVAGGVYWVAWQLGPNATVLNTMMVGIIFTQAAIAGIVMLAVAWRTVRDTGGSGGLRTPSGIRPVGSTRT